MARAAVDIGSNSIVLLVLGDDDTVLADASRVVSLGAGLDQTGRFAQDRMDAAMVALLDFSDQAAQFGIAAADIGAFATSASRRAGNAAAFFRTVAKRTGIVVRTITGLEEAQLTWAGATFDLDLPSSQLGMVDLGGGSTEIVWAMHNAAPCAPHSLPLGTVRLTEKFFGPDPQRYAPEQFQKLKAHIHSVISRADLCIQVENLIAVAGTATTLAAMSLGLKAWDREAVHGRRLSLSELDAWMDRLLASSATERQVWAAVSPKRADALLAGAAVLHTVGSLCGVDAMTVSTGGLRHGALLRT